MENLVEKQLDKRPVLTIVVLAIVAVSLALGFGIVTPIAGWAMKAKNFARTKLGTAPPSPPSNPAPTL
jgi:hypothetical protein